jgi:coenzyme F420-reducing hydrogenase gamma subunit
VNEAVPTLAVHKFASCDGCQLSLLGCESKVRQLSQLVRIAYFLEVERSSAPGPWDLSLVEGSISTGDDAARIREIRENSKALVAIGACATAGGVQGLRNRSDGGFASLVYPEPDWIDHAPESRPISDIVSVDYELWGCPVNPEQLLEVVSAVLDGRRPRIETSSVCMECKRNGNVCVWVASDTPCMGPVTRAGCGARCPAFDRGCYGCFGPQDTAKPEAWRSKLIELGYEPRDVERWTASFNGPGFGKE